MDKNDEERTMEFIERQIQRGLESAGPIPEPVYTEFVREHEEELIKLDLNLKPEKKLLPPLPLDKVFKRPASVAGSIGESKKPKIDTSSKKKTVLDEIREEEEKKREAKNRKDYWLTEGIVVKVITKSLGEEFYKQKGVVREVIAKYGAVVKLLETGKKLKLDQQHLETVIPAIGKPLKIVNGAYSGEIATLLSLDEKNFCVNVEIAKGVLKGRKVDGVQYEDVCKLYED